MTETNIQKAREVITLNPHMDIDNVLRTLGVSQSHYRKQYPDTPITADLAWEVIDAREEGKSLKQIQQIYNLTDSQLNYALYEPRATNIHRYSLDRIRLIHAMRSPEPWTQKDLAKKFGCSQSYVSRIAKEIGARPHRKKRGPELPDSTIQEIMKRNKAGESISSLAKEFNVSRDTIYKRMRKCKSS